MAFSFCAIVALNQSSLVFPPSRNFLPGTVDGCYATMESRNYTAGSVRAREKIDLTTISLFRSIDSLIAETDCHALLEQLRWPNGLTCIRCSKRRVFRVRASRKTKTVRKLYECVDCGLQFSATAGSLFHNSHLSLKKWFLAIYLMKRVGAKATAKVLQKQLEVPYKTAWAILKKIRAADAAEWDILDEPSAFGPPENQTTFKLRNPDTGATKMWIIARHFESQVKPLAEYLRRITFAK